MTFSFSAVSAPEPEAKPAPEPQAEPAPQEPSPPADAVATSETTEQAAGTTAYLLNLYMHV